MPAPYPQEFRDDVVRVARTREDGVTLAQIAKDFGIHEMTLHKWLRQADIEAGVRTGTTREDAAETRELKRRVRLLAQTELDQGANEEVIALAQAILDTQTTEIATMENLLTQN